MSLPDWNTHSAFMTDRTRTFATAAELSLDGTYRIYANAHPDNVEKLSLIIRVRSLCSATSLASLPDHPYVQNRDVVFKAFGWVIRHLFNASLFSPAVAVQGEQAADLRRHPFPRSCVQLKENYFGSFTHWVTFDEYKRRHGSNLQGDPLELKYRPGTTDVLDVSVQYELEHGLLLLPQGACASSTLLLRFFMTDAPPPFRRDLRLPQGDCARAPSPQRRPPQPRLFHG